jgi:sugar lactone lactonase YvrE
MTIKCVVASRCRLGESPLWSERRQCLYWLDIALDSHLFEWHPETARLRSWSLGELASGLARARDGDLIVLSEYGLSRFDYETGTLLRLAAAPFPMRKIRFNDCGCDSAGRLWTGTMWNDLRGEPAASGGQGDNPGLLCCFEPDGACRTFAADLGCPNTFAWSSDDRVLYTADSAAGALYVYAFDSRNGALGERRVFATPPDLGVPDGSAIDAQGYLWNARWGAACVARFAPNGTLHDVVPIPADHVTSCAFGGPDLDTLFVTTARVGLTAEQLAGQPDAGGIFAFKPRAPGTRTSAFAAKARVPPT